MTKPKKPNFSLEFRLEKAQLVVDNGYTHQAAAKAMGVGYSTKRKWVNTKAISITNIKSLSLLFIKV